MRRLIDDGISDNCIVLVHVVVHETVFQHMLVGDLQSDYTSGNMDVYTAI